MPGGENILEYAQRVLRTYGPGGIAVELGVIGLAIWLVLRFLRGTRGARMLTGFLLLLLVAHLVVQWIAEVWNLIHLKFLYEKFLLVIAFGGIVLFQPELRRALARLGEARFLRAARREIHIVSDELLDAVRSFHKNKIGAIIAIERGTGLGGVLETGVMIDAKVSSALLRSIFWPGSALHDLGVIIRNGRIAAARCQFPLADAGAPAGALGSRHRAALGLSEETDALVIVVSEETGRVSFVERGRLSPLTDIDRFRAELFARLGGSFRERPSGAGGETSVRTVVRDRPDRSERSERHPPAGERPASTAEAGGSSVRPSPSGDSGVRRALAGPGDSRRSPSPGDSSVRRSP